MKRIIAMLTVVVMMALSLPISAQAASENVTIKVASDKTVEYPHSA